VGLAWLQERVTMAYTKQASFVPHPQKGWTHLRDHVYHDAAGRAILKVSIWRTSDKRKVASQALPDGKGGWRTSDQGEASSGWTLYRLPQVLQAHSERPVLLVEGEKDVERLEALGHLATTSPGGAKNWRSHYAALLHGRTVTLLPDNDVDGEQYASDAGAALVAQRCTVHVLRLPGLPEKGDVSDWLDAGHTPEELKHLLATAPLWTPGAAWAAPLPLPSLLSDVPAMPTDMLPHGLRPWLTDIADRVQCPLEYVAVSALVAIAAIVGRRIGIYPKRHDDWLVIPNLWGMLVGRPGVLKSPAMVEALKPLDRLARQALQTHSKALDDHTVASAVHEAKCKAIKAEMGKAAKKGDDSRMEELGTQLGELVANAPVPPVARRYKTNDSTVEKLQDLLAANPHGLLLYRDELAGFLYALEKPGREGDREFYLECWNGNGSFTLDRIGRGTVHSTALCLSLLGSIQPGKLTEYVAGTIAGGIGDDGLLQRIQLAVWPDTPTTWTNVDRWPDTDAKQRAWTIFQRLATLQREHVPEPEGAAFERDIPPGIRFAPAAQDIFDRWRSTLEAHLRSGDLHPAMESHLAKYRSLMPTLALLFHLTFHAHQADFAPGCITPVSAHATTMAIRWCELLEQHALRVYAGDMARAKHRAHALAKHIRNGDVSDGDTVRSVYRKQWTMLRTPDDTYGALSVLESLHWVRLEAEKTAGRTRDG
jgi:hypothetical protein